jgi:cytosine/uracil/thiamine/allantoin permease
MSPPTDRAGRQSTAVAHRNNARSARFKALCTSALIMYANAMAVRTNAADSRIAHNKEMMACTKAMMVRCQVMLLSLAGVATTRTAAT